MSAAVFMLLFWLGFERFDSSRHIRFTDIPTRAIGSRWLR